MLIASHGSNSGTLLTSQGVLVGLGFFSALVAAATLLLQYAASHPRRRVMTVWMPTSARLVDRSVPLPRLRVVYDNDELADAHVSTVAVTYRGSGDIREESFARGRPFGIDLGARIVDLLGKSFEPGQAPVPRVEVAGTALQVGPDLVRKGLGMTFDVLTDGPCTLTTENPLADVDVRGGAGYQARENPRDVRHRLWRFWFVRIFTWTIIIFVAFYVTTDPATAHVLNRLGDALANWVNSL